MTFTLNDIALLLVALLIGLVLGFMLSGRGKYKRLWRGEQLAHRQTIKDRDTRLDTANERIMELERKSALAGSTTSGLLSGEAHGRDDFNRIRGITPQDEAALHQAGYHRYAQIAAISREEEGALEAQLGLKPGIIAREHWREQAALLNDRKDDEHASLYDRASRT